jgi:large subunit ribosomal protein L23
MTIHDVLLKPVVTEKGMTRKEEERTLCFQVAADANKIQVKQAVEKLFNVKVEAVRTANFEGKLRRRGRFTGYRSDWKKAYVKLLPGQKVPEFTEM